MEQDAKDPAAVTRSQNVVYQLPHDWASIAHVLAPVLDRVDDATRDLQLLIVTADAEAAAAASASVVRLAGGRAIEALAATSARRASRLLTIRPAHVVAGAPAELLALVQASSLKLEHVRIAVLAWVDELIAGGEEGALETLMAEIPKDAARVVVASEITPGVEALIERYARRARRVAPPLPAGDSGVALEYVTVSSASRLSALRRLLDDVDPARGVVYVRTEESEREAKDLLRALGYEPGAAALPVDGNTVRVARAAGAGETDLVVLYDIPATREELREAIGAQPRRIVALAQPRQLASLRVLAGGGRVTPFTLSEAGLRARSREEALRAELRETLGAGAFSRELLTLEPLLDNYDGIEVAAAALRLLHQARLERDMSRTRSSEGRTSGGPPAAMTRLFLNVGAIDNARPGDIVGAITNEAGITSAQLGKIDIRDNHSIVEVASDVAAGVVSKLTGIMVRGRRVVARVDQERPGRQGGGSGGGGGPRGRGGDRGERGGSRRDSSGGGGRDRRGERGSGPVGRRGPEQRNVDRAAQPPRSREPE